MRTPRMALHESRKLVASDRFSTPHELRAPPAVPAALESRRGRRGRGRRRSRGGGAGQRGCAIARRLRPPRSSRTRALLPPLAFVGTPQRGRGSLLGCRPARARAAAGRGLAAASLSAVAGSGRHRLGGDRPHRDRGRDRDQDENVRCAPSCSCARAGGLAVKAPAKVGLQRGARRRVPGSRPWRRASRAGRARCLDRPVDGCPSRCGADVFRLSSPASSSRPTRGVSRLIVRCAKPASARSALLLGERDREPRLRPAGLA